MVRARDTKTNREHDKLSFSLKAQADSLKILFYHLVPTKDKELLGAKILNCGTQKSQAGAPLDQVLLPSQQWGSPSLQLRVMYLQRDRGAALGGSSDAPRRCESTGKTAASVQGKFTRLSGSESRLEANRKSKQKKLRD